MDAKELWGPNKKTYEKQEKLNNFILMPRIWRKELYIRVLAWTLLLVDELWVRYERWLKWGAPMP